MTQLWEKCQKWLQDHFDMFKAKSITCTPHASSHKTQIFAHVALQWMEVWAMGNSEKVHQMTSKLPCNVWGQMHARAYFIITQDSNLRPFRSILGLFWVRAKFREMVLNDPKMTLAGSIPKVLTYTHKAQIFVRFTLRWVVLELWSNLSKWPQNDFDINSTHVRTSHFRTFPPAALYNNLYNEPLLSYGSIWW